MRRGFKSWAEQQALEQRRNLCLGADAPLSATRLALHLEIPIINPEQIPGMTKKHVDQLLQEDISSWSAITLNVKGGAMIILNTGHAPTRQESDLMHEMAHLICEHKPSVLAHVGGLPFPLREYDAVQEEEANWLGACLQLPRPALLAAVKRHMSLEQMVRYFHASEEMIRYRRQTTGVDRQMSRF